MQRVVVGLSGGVDSAVCAMLLRKQGFEVHGLFLDQGLSARADAERTAAAMGVPLHIADIRSELERAVCAPFAAAYLSGETPNPCILCNPAVKFKALLDCADALGAHYVATGHYAVTEERDGVTLLRRSPSRNDQSYMLCRLTQPILRRVLFPLGIFGEKEDVRRAAESMGIPIAHKPDSMEICFIPGNDYGAYLESRGVSPPPGDFVDEQGNVLGRHLGIHRYTVGQRRGLGIAGTGRYYVKEIDAVQNRVIITYEDPRATEIFVRDVSYTVQPRTQPFDAAVKIRHSKNDWRARVYPEEDRARVVFDPPARAPAKGQSAVFYDGDIVIGGGFIV